VRALEKPLDESSAVMADLTEIRAGNVLPRSRSDDLTKRLARLNARLREIAVPPEAAATSRGPDERRDARQLRCCASRVAGGPNPVQSVRDASAGAAGALLLFDRVRSEAAALSARPDDRSVKP